MNTASLFWFIVLGISAVVFFGIAIVVSIRGISDLRELLKKSEKQESSK